MIEMCSCYNTWMISLYLTSRFHQLGPDFNVTTTVPPSLVALEHGIYGLGWGTRAYVSKHYDHIYSIYVIFRNFCSWPVFSKVFCCDDLVVTFGLSTFFMHFIGNTWFPCCHIFQFLPKSCMSIFFIFILSWYIQNIGVFSMKIDHPIPENVCLPPTDIPQLVKTTYFTFCWRKT